MPTDCSNCYQEIAGRVIHDEGRPWCETCRKTLIVDKASAKADRVIAENIDNARILVQIQRKQAA